MLRPAIPLAALAGLALIYVASGKTVTVFVDGSPHEFSTHARTVGAGLLDGGWSLRTGDVVQPSPDTPLQSGAKIVLRRAYPVVVRMGPDVQSLLTVSRIPANILADAGVRVFPGDQISVDGLPDTKPGEPLIRPPSRVDVRRGQTIDVSMGGKLVPVNSSGPTVGQALANAGMALYEGDRVQPEADHSISGVSRVTLDPSRAIQIKADGVQIEARSSGSTVGQALAQAGVALVGLDYAKPAVDQPVPEDGQIKVIRVREVVKTELTPVAFDTVYQPVADLEIDNQQVIKTGSYGVEASQVRVRYEDGKEVGKTEEGSWLARQPESRVIGYGTKIVVRTMSTPDGKIEYWRAVKMWATSYSASRAGVSPDARNYGITASGAPLHKGLVAIDRRYIPFGTQMYVPGYGFALAADTGGGVKGRWIDLGYDDNNWVSWHQYVTVYFLTPVPPANSIVWIFP